MFLKFKQFLMALVMLGSFGLVYGNSLTISQPQLSAKIQGGRYKITSIEVENGETVYFMLNFIEQADSGTGYINFGQSIDNYEIKDGNIETGSIDSMFYLNWTNGFNQIVFSGYEANLDRKISFFVQEENGDSIADTIDINIANGDTNYINSDNLAVHNYNYTDNSITFTFDYIFGDDINSDFSIESIEDGENNNIDGSFEVNNENEYQVKFDSNSSLDNGSYVLNIDNGTNFKTKGVLSGSFDYNFELKDLEQTSKPIGLEIGNGTGISINQGADQTSSKVVNLRLKADSADEMCIWNEEKGCSNWVPYTEDKYSWTVKGDAGEKTVNVKFRNDTGESETYSSSIKYHTGTYFIGFNELNGRYTKASSIDLKGRCVLENSSFSGGLENNGTSKTIDCTNTNWSGSFDLTDGLNVIKLRSGDSYNNANIRNSLAIRQYKDTLTYTYNGSEYDINNITNTDLVKGVTDISNGQKELKFEFDFYGDSTYDFTRVSSPYIVCDENFELNDDGNVCVEKQEDEEDSGDSGSTGGGGGGGGGGTPTCRSSSLVCKEHMGEYVRTRKDGVSCRGGDLGESCDPDEVDEEHLEDESDSQEDQDSQDDLGDLQDTDSISIDSMSYKQIQNYLKTNFDITPQNLSNIPTKYTRQIAKQMSKSSSFDLVESNIEQNAPSEYTNLIQRFVNILEKNPASKFVNRYGQFGVRLKNFQNKYYNSFEQMVINLFEYTQTPNKSYVELVKLYLKQYSRYSSQYQDIKSEYVILQENNKYIPVDESLTKPFKALESIIFEYETTQLLETYNDFVFAIAVYRKDDDTIALQKAKSLAKSLINDYQQAQSTAKQQVKEDKNLNSKQDSKENIPQDTETISYEFDRTISLGDRGEHISDLQNFLASQGYRYENFDTTDYYGDISSSWLSQYLQDQHNLYIDTSQLSQDMLNTYIAPFIQ